MRLEWEYCGELADAFGLTEKGRRRIERWQALKRIFDPIGERGTMTTAIDVPGEAWTGAAEEAVRPTAEPPAPDPEVVADLVRLLSDLVERESASPR